LEEGTSAALIILLPYRREPETGSLIPSISVGGADMKPKMNTSEPTKSRGNIKIPKTPTYKRFEVVKRPSRALEKGADTYELE
jgi:hypothetical protein